MNSSTCALFVDSQGRKRARKGYIHKWTGGRIYSHLLAKHCAETQHEFDFKETQIIDREKQWHKRLFLEAWHSIADPNSINEHIQIPRSYHIFNCE